MKKSPVLKNATMLGYEIQSLLQVCAERKDLNVQRTKDRREVRVLTVLPGSSLDGKIIFYGKLKEESKIFWNTSMDARFFSHQQPKELFPNEEYPEEESFDD